MCIVVQHVNSVTFAKGEPAVACTCIVVIMLKYETMARQL